MLLIVFKALDGLAPSYLAELLDCHTDVRGGKQLLLETLSLGLKQKRGKPLIVSTAELGHGFPNFSVYNLPK